MHRTVHETSQTLEWDRAQILDSLASIYGPGPCNRQKNYSERELKPVYFLDKASSEWADNLSIWDRGPHILDTKRRVNGKEALCPRSMF